MKDTWFRQWFVLMLLSTAVLVLAAIVVHQQDAQIEALKFDLFMTKLDAQICVDEAELHERDASIPTDTCTRLKVIP